MTVNFSPKLPNNPLYLVITLLLVILIRLLSNPPRGMPVFVYNILWVVLVAITLFIIIWILKIVVQSKDKNESTTQTKVKPKNKTEKRQSKVRK